MAHFQVNGYKKAVSATLVLALLLSLTACKTKKGDGTKDEFTSGRVIQETDPFFDAEINEFKIPLKQDKKLESLLITKYIYTGGCAVASYQVQYELPEELRHQVLEAEVAEQYREYVTAIFDEKGNLLTKISEENEQKGILDQFVDGSMVEDPDAEDQKGSYNLLGMTKDANGVIYLLLRYYNGYLMEYGYEIRVVEPDGKTRETIPIKNPPTDAYDGGVQQMFDPNSGENTTTAILTEMNIQVLDDGNICLSGSERMGVYDTKGKRICEIRDSSHTFEGGLFKHNGKYYTLVSYYDSQDDEKKIMQMKEVDTKTGKLGATKDVSQLSGFSHFTMTGEGIFVESFNGCSRFDPDSGKTEEVFNWNYTDVDRSLLAAYKCTPYSDNEVFVASWSPYNNLVMPKLIHLTRAEKNPHAGKKVILVGGMGLAETGILPVVSKFNSDPENTTVRVALIDYLDSAAEATGEQEQKMYLDILSGSGPDVVVNMGEYEALRNGDVMEDLNPYLDGEKGIKREEYFDNILRACEKGGKLYHLPVEFYLQGVLANPDLVPFTDGWTFDEFLKTAQDISETASITKAMLYNDLLCYLLSTSMSRFVDYEKKTVDFQNEDMKKILLITKEYGVKKIPADEKYQSKTVTWGDEEEKNVSNYVINLAEEKFTNGILATRDGMIRMIGQVALNREMLNGKGVFLGYPSVKKTSWAVVPNLSLGISALSKYKDLAWEFIRSYLESDAENEEGRWGLPIRKAAFEKECVYDMNVTNKSYDEWVEKDPLTPPKIIGLYRVEEKDIDTLRDLVAKADVMMTDDNTIINIICEEAAGYFAGDRTADDVLRNIQNRTRLVVAET